MSILRREGDRNSVDVFRNPKVEDIRQVFEYIPGVSEYIYLRDGDNFLTDGSIPQIFDATKTRGVCQIG